MAERNRQMLAAYEAGESVKALAAQYGLKQASVRTLLTAEKHRRAVCPEPLYRALRGESVPA